MVFKNDKPVATDKLLTSQQDLLANNQQLQASYTLDHYGFVATTPADANGKHRNVTLVAQSESPTTATDEPKIYSIDIGSGEVIAVAKQAGNGKSSGLSAINGVSVGAATVPVLDCASLPLCIIEAYAYSTGATNSYARGSVMWSGAGAGGSTFYGVESGVFADQSFGTPTLTTKWSTASTFVNLIANNTNTYYTLHIRRLDV